MYLEKLKIEILYDQAVLYLGSKKQKQNLEEVFLHTHSLHYYSQYSTELLISLLAYIKM